ncbi:hypothetical protein HYS28_00460 [Candidatus Uhrbacteria bacterium]|nr:hypothetical protein [Candidatus Uhrbacteria bacterium]
MNMMERPRPTPQQEGFTKEEEDFFNSPVNPDAMRPAEDPFAVGFDTALAETKEDAFIESHPTRGEFSPDERAFFGDTVAERQAADASALEAAKVKLEEAEEDEDDVPTEPMGRKVTPLFAGKWGSDVDEGLVDKFFAEGEKKYGADDGPEPDGGEREAA